MADQHSFLTLTLRFFEGRYHGEVPATPTNRNTREWPPSPARLFQALVAASPAGCSNQIPDAHLKALAWLEGLAPPLVAHPQALAAASILSYVPNNNADAFQTSTDKPHNRLWLNPSVKTGKQIKASTFHVDQPLLYAWELLDDEYLNYIGALTVVSHGVYQVGRGVDAAYADVAVTTREQLRHLIESHGLLTLHPQPDTRGQFSMPCPVAGSTQALTDAYLRKLGFLQPHPTKRRNLTLEKSVPVTFRQVAYRRRPRILHYDLVALSDKPLRWPQRKTVALTEAVRQSVFEALHDVFPEQTQTLERTIVGRGADARDKTRRIQIIPLPSIGYVEADHDIRRICIVIAQEFPFAIQDLEWALARGTMACEGEQFRLLKDSAPRHMRHFGANALFWKWRTVTPIVMPNVQRPTNRRLGGSQYQRYQENQQLSIQRALAHADLPTTNLQVDVQKIPFHKHGLSAADAIRDTRFDASAATHAMITLSESISGPLIVGNGRYLGLGLLQPAAVDGIYTYELGRTVPVGQWYDLTRLMRAALMSHVGREREGDVGTFFSGHEPGGSKAEHRDHNHLFFLPHVDANKKIHAVSVVSPHLVQQKQMAPRLAELQCLARVAPRIEQLASSKIKPLRVSLMSQPQDLRELASSSTWGNATRYHLTNHPKRTSPAKAIIENDVKTECKRRGLPDVQVQLDRVETGPRGGVSPWFRLRFEQPVTGPILLGAYAHFGGGTCVPTPR